MTFGGSGSAVVAAKRKTILQEFALAAEAYIRKEGGRVSFTKFAAFLSKLPNWKAKSDEARLDKKGKTAAFLATFENLKRAGEAVILAQAAAPRRPAGALPRRL